MDSYHELKSRCGDCQNVSASVEVINENTVELLDAILADLTEDVRSSDGFVETKVGDRKVLELCNHSRLTHEDTYFEYKVCQTCGSKGIWNVDISELITFKGEEVVGREYFCSPDKGNDCYRKEAEKRGLE